jgi:peptidoglycan hydrolase-like amidase
MPYRGVAGHAYMKIKTTFLALIMASSLVVAQNVRIGVLGLFHPRQFELSVPAGSALVVHIGEESVVLEGTSGVSVGHISARGDNVVLDVGARILRGSELTAASRASGPVDFNLAVPGKIKRHYRGTVEIKPDLQTLTAVVTMDLETAVASVVVAESAVDTPSEALKALAVAARSYFVAGKGRHPDFDFCDTTHCQFLREPLPGKTAVAQAVSATQGLIIAYQSQPVAAMYSRSCGGRTRTPAELGLPPATYPYYSVDCKYCRQHPSRWESRLSTADGVALRDSNESSRLRLGRRLGWAAVPSNNYVLRQEGEQTVLRGVGQGHGIGLCQAGAEAMAEEGADFHEILAHYYPNTIIITLGRAAPLR